LIQLE
jgi:hypothetical protein